MAGSLLFIVIVLVGAVALVLGAPALLIFPVGIGLVLGALMVPLLRGMNRPRGGGRGVPTTDEASYDPVAEPPERP